MNTTTVGKGNVNQQRSMGGAIAMVVLLLALAVGIVSFIAPNFWSDATGVVAVVAFGLVFVATVFTAMRNAAANSVLSTREARKIEDSKKLYLDSRLQSFREERERIEKKATDLYEQAMKDSSRRFNEIVVASRVALDRIACDVAECSKLEKDQSQSEVAEEWHQVIDEQWAEWANDLGYVGTSEIEKRVQMASESWRAYDGMSASRFRELGLSQDGESSSLNLAQSISRLRMEAVNELMAGYSSVVESFLWVYEREREWISQVVFQSILLLREVGKENVTLADTNMNERLIRLKLVFGLVVCLGDSIKSESSSSEDGEARRSKVVRTCINLSILGEMPTWFSEVGLLESGDVVGNQSEGAERDRDLTASL
ncbi:hypothetical protein [Pelagicoccus mobilis]|uniref:Uncharacterized protein n=1 Tax=Pelagicoccus mobilis TaxID=415221 RepID=A0A934RXY2_9BACT|nr:hypothetical protein [Pelagicoccus mobilis]MBK1879775.1 hypothetical protein [Pelagicoccus mobilis]